jgi:hypothetical protein
MRVIAFTISFLLGVLGATSCGPTKKCTAATCSGCCSANDTCEGGTQVSACGSSGALCDKCVGTQTCSLGKCEGGVPSGGGSATGGGGAGGGSAGGASGNDFVGTYQAIWGWDGDGGRTAQINNFRTAKVGVWYRDGGAPDFVRGAGSDDGTFVVRDVPPGEVTLQLDKRFFVTTSREVHFDTVVGGRKDAVKATAESALQLTITGLATTSASRETALFFTQGTGTIGNVENTVRPVVGIGATSIE